MRWIFSDEDGEDLGIGRRRRCRWRRGRRRGSLYEGERVWFGWEEGSGSCWWMGLFEEEEIVGDLRLSLHLSRVGWRVP